MNLFFLAENQFHLNKNEAKKMIKMLLYFKNLLFQLNDKIKVLKHQLWYLKHQHLKRISNLLLN